MLLLLILVPVVVAGLTSLALVRREAAAAAGTGLRHPPRAAGFGQGGQPVPVESAGDAGLAALLETPLRRPWWLRTLRLMVLALLLAVAAAVVAGGIYELGKGIGRAFKHFVTGG